MATWNEADWHDEADGDIAQESARVAAQNSSLECDIDVSVTVARSNYTAAAKSSGPFVDVPSEKSGLSLDEDSLLDGDLDKDFPPGDGVLIPGLSDVSLSPKHTITADPLDMLPDSSEPHFRISEQSLAESAVLHPEMSDISLKEDKATSTAEVIIIEDLPVRPKSPYQTRNRPQISAQRQLSPFSSPEKLAPPPAESRPMPPPLSQRNQLGARRKAATVSAEVPNSRSVGAEAAPPVMAKGSVANQFLEKIGQLRGAAVLSEGCHDTYTLAEDLMSIEGAQNQPDKYKKEDFGELFTKKSLNAAQFAPKLQSQTETEAESEDEESSLDFDHLPIRRRMDIWKRREDRAIRKGLILIPKVGKQGRFPISAAGL
ncbi:uncharacterized protein LOC119436557 isoform X4 [Dermacentor silvarum]|uniref:uncharacterized protein LOC119436557 isoform X4 n=1 Tax=Dermacentor silvarum TaxID=543639 RepID=UPI002101C186|nr:uncharacterized protein LOC119436557 isoform X4 [Dermacentor silvarum]